MRHLSCKIIDIPNKKQKQAEKQYVVDKAAAMEYLLKAKSKKK